jgi:hypothetical protein
MPDTVMLQTKNIQTRLLPLAASLSSLLGSVSPMLTAQAATLPVTSCADDGGLSTLRYVAQSAGNDDIVDLSSLGCSTITLASGEINIGGDRVTLQGPADRTLSIDATYASRVFFHYGATALVVSHLTVLNGKVTAGTALGGCIYSTSSIALDHATVRNCSVNASTTAAGGGIAALKNLYVLYSAVTGNTANATGTTGTISAAGGGAFAGEELLVQRSIITNNNAQSTGTAGGGGGFGDTELRVKYSTISGNHALGPATNNHYGVGGGLAATAATYALIEYSTVDHNLADAGGGLVLVGASTSAVIKDSTISSNVANLAEGGVSTSMNLSLLNSTIAFNSAGPAGGGGLVANGTSADLESSIIANNSPGGLDGGADLGGGAVVTGANNLIRISSIPVPALTKTDDPKLLPLACHGGTTRVHAFADDSPAIDAGSSFLTNDQRGPGFGRSVGASPDIGAYEFDPDRIFTDGLDCG